MSCNDGKKNYGYVEGYVDNGSRVVRPYDPSINNITEIIVGPPSGGGGVLYVQYAKPNITLIDGDLLTLETFLFAPVSKGDMWITVNGIAIYPSNGVTELSVSAFYVTDSTGTIIRPKGTYLINDLFHWNPSFAGYNIDLLDEIKIIYEA